MVATKMAGKTAVIAFAVIAATVGWDLSARADEFEVVVGRSRIVSDVLTNGDNYIGERFGIWGYLGSGTDWFGTTSYYVMPYLEFGNGSMRDALGFVAVRIQVTAEDRDTEVMETCLGDMVVVLGTLTKHKDQYVLELSEDFESIVSYSEEKKRTCL